MSVSPLERAGASASSAEAFPSAAAATAAAAEAVEDAGGAAAAAETLHDCGASEALETPGGGSGSVSAAMCEGLSPSPAAAAAAAAAGGGRGGAGAASPAFEDASSLWLGEQAAAVAGWLDREKIEGVYKLLVESLLTPTPKTNAGSRLTSLASRASQLPAVPGVVYDAHHYQFLARFFEDEKSVTPTTKRFPLRRWGFHKSFRFACDAVHQAWRPGEFGEGEIPPLEETVARDSRAAAASSSSSSSSSMGGSVGLCGSGELVDSYVLLEYPDLVLPVVKGVSRDKKSRRWAVYYRGQRHYFYDKNCGGCRKAYELAVRLRRQQVEEVEISQVCDEHLQQMQQGAPQGGPSEPKGPCPSSCIRALVAFLLSDFAAFISSRGQETLGLGEEASAAAAAAAAHAAAAKHATGMNPILEHLALLRECIVHRKLPSQLLPQQQLLLLRQLLLLQLASVKDLLLQTGLWRAILLHATAGQQQQQQQQKAESSNAQINGATETAAVAAAADSASNAAAADVAASAAAEATAAAAEATAAAAAAQEASMCVDC
ncbi:hypothetical protein Efla_004701 [Eimeria flavescens]